MDAHVFRRLGADLCPLLMGARLEKIQSPADDVYVLSFYAQKRKQNLVFKASRRDPFLYISKERPTVGTAPAAKIMRMRKYCAGRRVVSCTVDWLNRRLLLLFSTKNNDAFAENVETWLVLDLRNGPELVLGSCPELPPEDSEIIWPEFDSLQDAEQWREYPMLTPALRRTLLTLDELDAKALIMDLMVGGGDTFVYGQGFNAELSAWPLSEKLRAGRNEQIFDDPILASTEIGDELVLGSAAQKVRTTEAAPHKREFTRLTRLLKKLDDEEIRLQELVALQKNGLLLQKSMWQYEAETKLNSIEIEDINIKLDPRYSLSENMQMFFHKAGRGRRGLEYLEQRREKLQEQLQALNNAVHGVMAGALIVRSENKAKNVERVNLPKGVEAFYSADNFVILRGKDAKGNWAALRMAAAQDLWLHVEGGPGAHCIIRRHFAGQEIPERSLEQAAQLAAIKSWQKDNPYAQIICAEVRHVKPMRNAAAGMVRIDKVWRSFRVNVDVDVEAKSLG